MNETPLFSVLIANYNNGKYLQEAIDSVLSQTYTNWEIIIVDDKSTDNSFDIYKKYESDPRFHIFYNDENKGCGYTKRRCAEQANGEICGFLDPDDVLLQDALYKMQQIHKKDSVSVVLSRSYLCDENMFFCGKSRRLFISEGETYLTNQDYGPEHFVTYKNSFYKKTDGIDPYLKRGVDQDLYFRLEEVGDIYIYDEVVYKIRMHKNSISRVFYGKKASYWNYAVRYNACKRRGIDYDVFLDRALQKEYEIEKLYIEKYLSVINSHAYKLGVFLLQPAYFVKRIISRL